MKEENILFLPLSINPSGGLSFVGGTPRLVLYRIEDYIRIGCFGNQSHVRDR